MINPTFATACLPSDDFKIVGPYLEATKLDRDYVLILPNIPIEYVNFVEIGMVLVVAQQADGRSTEVGVYGRYDVSAVSLPRGGGDEQSGTFGHTCR